MSSEKTRSNWWYLLPILFGLIGGIIAYFALRSDDPKKAKNCMVLSVILLLIGIVLNFIFATQISQFEQDLGINIQV